MILQAEKHRQNYLRLQRKIRKNNDLIRTSRKKPSKSKIEIFLDRFTLLMTWTGKQCKNAALSVSMSMSEFGDRLYQWCGGGL